MTTAPLVLVGGGGHAAVVADVARSAGWPIAGYLDDRAEDALAQQIGLKRLGAIDDLDAVLERLRASGPAPVAHPASGNNTTRRRWVDAIGQALASALVDSSAVVSPSARLAAGVLVGPRAVVNARAVIERGSIVNTGAIVEHDCIIGAFSHVAPGAVLGGGATIGKQALVGLGAVVLPMRRIGSHATLGAGAIANQDLPDGLTGAGNPMRVLTAETSQAAR